MKADKAKVARLLKTARGQLDGILKMVEEDRYCVDISNQLMATQALLRRVNREVLRAHMKGCVQDAVEQGNPQEAEAKIDELCQLLEKLVQ